MRAAPVGAYFSPDVQTVISQAILSAEITHSHPEGIAGAVAVALAASQACRFRDTQHLPSRDEFLGSVLAHLQPSEVRSRLVRSLELPSSSSPAYRASLLGNGSELTAQDTVPYALWCCSESLGDFPRALKLALEVGGDRDTLCAIVGGVVASFVGREGIPATWLASREPLPRWAFDFTEE